MWLKNNCNLIMMFITFLENKCIDFDGYMVFSLEKVNLR